MLIQLSLLVAIQLQPPGAVTLMLPVPPVLPKEALVGEMEYEQLLRLRV
jgi:hypothetical protein